jgi:large subunit ribosomal protein L25
MILKASKREVIGKKVKVLRREGLLPAVLYGKEFEPIPLSLDQKTTTTALTGLSSTSLVKLELEGEEYTTLIRERTRDVIKGNLIHLDFQVISLTERVRAEVSIVLDGESPATKDIGGLLVSGVDSIEVQCLPEDLPESINVDLSLLENIGDGIYVRDLTLPETIEVLTDDEDLIVYITAPSVEEVVEEVEEIEDVDVEPEVIEKSKKEDEEEATG